MKAEKDPLDSSPNGNSLKSKLHQEKHNSFASKSSAKLLHQRLDSLNNVARRRSSFALDKAVIENGNIIPSGFPFPALLLKERPCVEGDDKSSGTRVLAHRDTDVVTDTEAGKRLENIFDRYSIEKDEDSGALKKRSKGKKGLNRIQVKRGERRKRSIQTLQNELKKNSSRYLSRSANSLRFHLRGNPNLSDIFSPNAFPIPVNKVEMDPHVLLTLSCEKLAIDRGKRLLKAVVLHQTSQQLFVLMYWFIHCRFFQKSSSSEQRHLLTMIASVFPNFITMLKGAASPKERDVIFRFYPFVLAKGIFMGFKYLCPGNQNLFKGAFQRILYLSIFRLLTGLDICPESIDALRLKLYPEDLNEEDPSDANSEQDTKLRPMGNQLTVKYSTERSHRSNNPADAPTNSLSAGSSSHANISEKRDSLVKFVGDRESLQFRPENVDSLGPKKVPRQQQVQFDAYQISPLLQQYLKDSNSIGPKHFIKRTEPVSNCVSGGVETYQSRNDVTAIQQEDQIMTEHKLKNCALRRSSMQARLSKRKQLKALASQREQLMSGGKVKMQEFVASMMSGNNNSAKY